MFRAQDEAVRKTVAYARLYGSRSRKNQKLLDSVRRAVEEAHA